ncbi:MAG: HAMP domain-containing histidine kinase [Clostridia bacterium]|nr:HAMP domain-containing histidine kinase [Clostridia bacterium]
MKSTRYHILLKLLAFLMIALALTSAFVLLLSIVMMEIPFETIIEPEYAESREFNIRGYSSNMYDQTEWNQMRAKALPRAQIFGASILLAIVLLIYLTNVVGQNEKGGTIHLSWHDKIPSDVLIVVYACVVPIWFLLMEVILFRRVYSTNNIDWELGASGVVTFLLISALGLYYVSSVKQIKAKTFIKKSLWFQVLYWIYDLIKSLFDGRAFSKNGLTKSLFKRQLVFIVASAFMVFLTFVFLMVPPLMLLPPIMECVIIYWFIKGNRKTYEAIDKGFNDSLEEQMKAERMKIQLITNVSHDLKTPLTSIIGYVDLLSKEPLEEPAREYVTVLTEKSDRLKYIVSDLFDLAKSTTGNIQVDFEEIDLKRLIQQTMGDLSDEIEKSGLEFKMQLPEDAVLIHSDGKKLYRVFMNLIGNALQYALMGTRVYVTLETSESIAKVSIKNIAGYEMTFTEEEVLQRFTRGDQARTSEGSGLGLSIAESFTHVCGGKFELVIDGDLFKANVSFPVK